MAVDDDKRQQIDRIVERILDIIGELERIETEPMPKTEEVAACRAQVDQLVTDYRALLEQLPADERDDVDRKLGRRVVRLRRKADDVLPGRTAGAKVPLAAKNQWGPSGMGAARAQVGPKRKHVPVGSERRQLRDQALGAGREVDSWCGPCEGMQTHTIIAMVGDTPKQVVCESCGARHGYRAEAPAKKTSATIKRDDPERAKREAEEQRKQSELAALRKELAEASARPFVKGERYRTGEIIEHPEHGRGKIEHATRGSLLVRFSDTRRTVST